MPPWPGSTDQGPLGRAGGEGLVEPQAGSGGADHSSRVPVPIAASLLFRCPPTWPAQGKEQIRPCPRALLSALHPLPSRCIIFCLIFF